MAKDLYVSAESDFPAYVEGLVLVADPSGENFEITDSDLDDDAIEPSFDTVYDADFEGVDTDNADADGTDSENTTSLIPPENMTIISQTVRQNAGGVQVVDVVIGFTDVDGAATYEVRVTKN